MDKRQLLIIVVLIAAFAAFAAVMLISGAAASKEKEEQVITADDGASMTVTGLKCGSADAYIIVKDGHAAVIDCGESDDGGKVVSALKLRGIDTVDIMIISHFDQDHVGGAAEVIRECDVKEVYVTYLSKDSDEIDDFSAACEAKGLTPVVISEDTVLTLPGASMTVYPPQKDDYGSDTSNNSSLAVMLEDEATGKRMFFTGDAENKRIKELTVLGDIACDVLKVPHHGRWESRFPELVAACSPQYAVINSSDTNPEDKDTLDALEQSGVSVYLTRSGTVTFEFFEDRIDVKQ